MARSNGGVQTARKLEARHPASSPVEERWLKIHRRIGKLERQVRRLDDCVRADGRRLSAEDRLRLRFEIARCAVRLHEAAERKLDEIAGLL